VRKDRPTAPFFNTRPFKPLPDSSVPISKWKTSVGNTLIHFARHLSSSTILTSSTLARFEDAPPPPVPMPVPVRVSSCSLALSLSLGRLPGIG
jgi:hypothetical protein